jgi:hypothetical protein
MRRSITTALAAGLVLLATAGPAAAKPEATGPKCADILVTGNYTTDTDTGNPTVTFLFDEPLASCSQVTYSAYVYASAGGTLLASGSTRGDGGQIGYLFELPGGPSSVCLSATSSSPGGKTFDAAPDTGCVVAVLDAGGGLSKFG